MKNKTFLKINIIFVFTVFCLMLFPNTVSATTEPSFDLVGVSCKAFDDTEDGLDDCYYAYDDEEPNAPVLTDEDKIEPGDIIMVGFRFNPNDYSNVTGVETSIYIDPNIWEIVMIDGEAYIKKPRFNALNYTVGFEYIPNLNAIGGSYMDTSTRSKEVTYLKTEQEFFYFFVKLKEGVSGTASLSFSTDPSVKHTTTLTNIVGTTVTAADGPKVTTTDLKIAIAGDTLSGDNSLGTLTITKGDNNYTLNPSFVSGPSGASQKEYSTFVAPDAATAVITATAFDIGASITGEDSNGLYYKTVSLNPGQNTFTIIVTSASHVAETYKINIYRLSDDATLSGITLDGINNFTFNGSKEYRIEVPYRTDVTNVSATPNHENGFISSGEGEWSISNFGTQENQWTIVSRAENCANDYLGVPGNSCSTETYTITIDRLAPSTVNTLSSLQYKASTNDAFRSVSSFSSTTFEYELPNVSNATTSISFKGVLTDSLASIEIPASFPLQVGENTITLTVVPEDPTAPSQDYVIKVYRESNDADLTSLEVKSTDTSAKLSPDFGESSTNKYTYEFDASVDTVTVTATVRDTGKAKVAIYEADDLSSAVATPNTLTKSFGIDPNATSREKDIVIMVTAEDGTTKAYNLKLRRKLSTDSTLKKLELTTKTGDKIALSPTFASGIKLYTATVDADTDYVNVIAELNSKYAKILSINGNEDLNYGNNTITVSVDAESPNNNGNYMITVYREYHHEATLENIYIDGVALSDLDSSITFNRDTKEYTINTPFPYETNKVNVTVDKTNDLATVTGTGEINLATKKNTINIQVTAHDGIAKETYKVHLTRNTNSDNSISNLKVGGVSATLDREVIYAVTLPNNVTSITAADVTFNYASDATVEKDESLELSTKHINEYKFTVTAENGDKKEYTIKITRAASNNVEMGEVTVTTDENVVKTCRMNLNTKTCTVEVPTGTDAFTISADIHSEATVSPANGEPYAMPPEESIKEVQLTVTAEDKTTTETYTVRVERQLSSNNYLSYIKLNGEYISEYTTGDVTFRPDLSAYELTVNGDTSSALIEADVVDTGKAKIITDLTEPFNLYFDIRNKIEIKVKAENKEENTYTLYITREPRKDVTLRSLTIDGYPIPGFEPDKTEYYLDNVPYTKYQMNVQATPTDSPRAVVATNGVKTLSTGDNTIVLIVTAHDPSVQERYEIHVNRAKNTSTSIEEITIEGVKATWDNAEKKYKVTVPHLVGEANHSNLNVKVTDAISAETEKATVSFTDTELLTTEINTVKITVTPEDPDAPSKEYILEIEREKCKKATLSSLTVTTTNDEGGTGSGSFNPSFLPDNDSHLEYNITVPVDATSIDIIAVKSDPHSKITSGVNADGTGHIVLTGSNQTVEITVTSEDDSVTRVYKLSIMRTKSSTNTLKSITVTTDAGETYTYDLTENPSKTTYDVPVRGTATHANISAVKTDERSSVDINPDGYRLNVGNNPIVLTVESETGDKFYYTVNIQRALKEDNYLSNLTVNDSTVPGFNTTDITDVKEKYVLPDVPYTTTSINLGATTNDEDATIKDASTVLGSRSLVVGLNTFEITVNAQNGTPRTYTIEITREQNSNNFLRLLSVSGSVLTPNFNGREEFNYETTVDETKAELLDSDVTAVAEDEENARVDKMQRLTLSTTGENIYIITVTAQNGRTQIYRIKVNRPQSTDARIKDVTITGGTLNKEFNPDIKDYEISIPYGSETFTIEAEGVVGTTEIPELGEINIKDLPDGKLKITTTSEDGHTETYTFTVVVAQSNDATLASLSVDGYPLDKTFNSAVTTYNIGDIIFGVTQLKINAKATNDNADIRYFVDGVRQDSNIVNIPNTLGQKTITVQVIAANGVDTKSYTIDYTIIHSPNAYLSELIPSVGTLSPEFLKTKEDYDISVNNSVTSISFDIKTEDSNANITVNGEIFSTPKTITINNLKEGDNTLTILVTAPDGKNKKTYNVIIKRLEPTASTDSKLSSLSVEGHTFNEPFNIDKLGDYSIGNIPYGEKTLTIHASKNFEGSKITYLVDGEKQDSNVVTIPDTPGNHAITVQVTAEDGHTVSNYKIILNKAEPSKNAYLSNLVVSGCSLDPTFNKEATSYKVVLDESVTSVNLTATTEDSKAKMTINGTEYSSPHVLTLTNLDNPVEVTIIVQAEDPTVKQTYKVRFTKNDSILDIITSDEYGHTISDDYIETVAFKTTGLELKNQLDNENQYLQIWDADETSQISDGDTLKTGMIVKLIINGVETDRKGVVILGDTNGDGNVNILDAVRITTHIRNESPLTGAYLVAANTNGDASVNILDAVRITTHIRNENPFVWYSKENV